MNLGPLAFSPLFFWLAVPGLAALVLIRLLQARWQVLPAGSLLLWKRVAALQPKARPKRIFLDRTLLLQALAVLALAAAASAPALAWGTPTGRRIVLMLDNGPAARLRQDHGAPVWEQLAAEATALLGKFDSADRIYLACSAPFPKLLSQDALSPEAARAQLHSLQPALSSSGATATWTFAANLARAHLETDAGAALVLSAASAPAELTGKPGKVQWRCIGATPAASGNIGITHWGSAWAPAGQSLASEIVVRVQNFTADVARGKCVLEKLREGAPEPLAERPLELKPGADNAVVFTLSQPSSEPIRVSWRPDTGIADALPEDDSAVALPRPPERLSIRFHGAAPALQALYEKALQAEILEASQTQPATLEVYVRAVPEQVPAGARTLLLLQPATGYRSIFDVGGTLERPQAQRGEDDPLTRGWTSETKLFEPGRSVEFLATGDFKPLIRDAQTQRALAARFQDEGQRKGFLLAFVPGETQPERPLEPALAAFLVRLALEAANAGAPFETQRVQVWEASQGAAVPLSWRAGVEKGHAWSLLDAQVSAAKTGTRSADEAWRGDLRDPRQQSLLLAPWCVLAGLIFIFGEARLNRKR